MEHESLLKREQVVELTGQSDLSIRNWTVAGYLTPMQPGVDKGHAHLYSFPQVVAVNLFTQIRETPQSCHVPYLNELNDAFSKVDSRWLEEKFEVGFTHFVMIHDGLPLLREAKYDWVNVQEIYETAKEKCRELVG